MIRLRDNPSAGKEPEEREGRFTGATPGKAAPPQQPRGCRPPRPSAAISIRPRRPRSSPAPDPASLAARRAHRTPAFAVSKPAIKSSRPCVRNCLLNALSPGGGCYLGKAGAAGVFCRARSAIRYNASDGYLSVNAPLLQVLYEIAVLCEGDYRGSGSITSVDVGSDYSALSILPIRLSVSICHTPPPVFTTNRSFHW